MMRRLYTSAPHKNETYRENVAAVWNLPLEEILRRMDIYERWLFSEEVDNTDPPFDWDFMFYDDLCEDVAQLLKVTGDDKK